MAGGEDDGAGVGLERLHDHAPRRRAPAAAGELGDELEGALLGAEVRHREAGVGIDDGGEDDVVEVVPLGDHLRAEQDGAVGAAEALQRLLELGGPGRRVGVEPDPLEPGHVLLELPLEPLRAGADADELRRAAGGAELVPGLLVSAVVAAEGAVPVEHERDVAPRAAARLAARPAVESGDEAAPVEEQDRLAAVALDVGQRGEQRRGQRIAGLAAHVHDGHGRKRGAEAGAELQPLEARPALGARRGRAVDGDGTLERGAFRGDGAGVVARVGLLLVRRVVLLVDADEPEPRQRREDRRSGSDDHRRRAGGDPFALVTPLRLGQPGMKDGDAIAEPGAEASERLRRQRDLRDEHDRAVAARDGRCAGLEIHLGLAAAGRAVEQEVAAAVPRGGLDALERLPLRRAQLARLGLAAERVVAARAARLAAPGGLRRRDQGERAGRRRAVVVGRPEREVDEGGRQLVQEPSGGDRLDPVRRRVLEPDDDAAALRSPELDGQDGALADLLPHLVRERPRERPRRDERIDGCVGHPSSLARVGPPEHGPGPDRVIVSMPFSIHGSAANFPRTASSLSPSTTSRHVLLVERAAEYDEPVFDECVHEQRRARPSPPARAAPSTVPRGLRAPR